MSYVCWMPRTDGLPDDGTVCAFHVVWRKDYSICFGFYLSGCFYEKVGRADPVAKFAASKVDYWLPIPILPKGCA